MVDCDATALRSRQVLECDAEVLMLGVPGLALPDSALATAMLPSVPDMVDASIANSRLARRVARTPSPEAPTQPNSGTHPSSCRMSRWLNQPDMYRTVSAMQHTLPDRALCDPIKPTHHRKADEHKKPSQLCTCA